MSTAARTFAAALGAEALAGALGPDLPSNFDPLRHPDGPPDGFPGELAVATLEQWLDDAGLARVHDLWADDPSRSLMVRLLAFRLLGARNVRLPLAGAPLDAAVAQALALRTAERTVDLQFLGWHGDRYDLSPLGLPIELDAHLLNIVAIVLDQYRCPQHPHVAAREGDVVLDGGGCWGDTALVFAHLVGPSGHVRSFEFEPGNLERFAANRALNAELAERVTVEERALWHTSDETLRVARFGPATNVGQDGDMEVTSVAIDDLVQKDGLDRVDFVKLDVEGAELAALHGARETLERHRPRLAVALYHRLEDWSTIPSFLDDLQLGYRFSLGHFTVHSEETVLFAWPE